MRNRGRWAKVAQVKYTHVYGASAAKTDVALTVRWASALPVRQALTRTGYGSTAQAPEGGGYLVEIAGFPAIFVGERAKKLEAELAKSARLSVRGRAAVRAESASVPPFGMHLMATVRFAPIGGLTPDEGEVVVSASALGFELRQPFRLAPMVYRGRLEL